MTRKMYIHITLISFIIGLMLAVQYNTVQSPEKKETTDVWEIRQDLSDEKKLHSELLTNIRQAQDIVRKYEDKELGDPEAILAQTVEDLQEAAGLKEVTGPGITISITPSPELIAFGYEINEISPSLLIRLVNDIYRYKGHYIELNGQRVIHSSAIRDINGKTTVGSVPIGKTNVEMIVITETEEEAAKLYNHLMASSFMDEFFIDNMMLTVEQPETTLTVRATDMDIRNTYLTEHKGD
ncbi:DUF881 domain-containing protein [Lysinibacillus sp. KU-BSD001]|uniref:DUF881 domain-containing protein n=1 Tax=Lysinibacillus sp. KU-BSD001 TaxID=3141328 RepID=UPI0036EFF1EB